jgi:hypothetical protein
MLARVRRLTVVLVAAVVTLATGPAAPASAGADPRLRTNPGPTARSSLSPAAKRSRASASAVTLRQGRPVAGGTEGALRVPTAVAHGSAAGRAGLASVVETHFDAIPRLDASYPADPTGAVGRTSIVTAVNSAVAVYDRDGTELLAPTRFSDLVPGLLGQKYDPKVVFDQYIDTFILTFLVRHPSTRQSWIVVTTIPDRTAAQQSTWCGTQLIGDGVRFNRAQWADYPAVGYDSDSVAIATNAFDFGGRNAFRYAQIYWIANIELFRPECNAADPVSFTAFARSKTREPGNTRAFTIQPAQTEGLSNGDQFLLSYDPSSPAVVVWRLRETANGPALRRSAISVGHAKISPYGTQRGGSYRDDNTWWDPGDLRFVNAFYDADLRRLYAAHVVYRDLKPDRVTGAYPEAAIRWYEVHPTRSIWASKLTRSGIVGTAESDAGWPVVATDASGSLFITYNRASKPLGEHLSAWAAEIPPGTTQATLTLLTAGTATMENGLNGQPVERWGDFNAINRDPLDGAFIGMVNQYAKSDGGRTTRDWQETFDLVAAR